MTNEIKEILDRFYNEYPKCEKILEKYITDLQEEKENAVECLKYYEEKHFIKPAVDNMKLTTELYNAYSKEINDLQQRIDKAIEYCNNNIEFTPRLIDVIDILRGDE